MIRGQSAAFPAKAAARVPATQAAHTQCCAPKGAGCSSGKEMEPVKGLQMRSPEVPAVPGAPFPIRAPGFFPQTDPPPGAQGPKRSRWSVPESEPERQACTGRAELCTPRAPHPAATPLKAQLTPRAAPGSPGGCSRHSSQPWYRSATTSRASGPAEDRPLRQRPPALHAPRPAPA